MIHLVQLFWQIECGICILLTGPMNFKLISRFAPASSVGGFTSDCPACYKEWHCNNHNTSTIRQLELTDRRATNRAKNLDCITLFHFKLKKRISFTHCMLPCILYCNILWRYLWVQLVNCQIKTITKNILGLGIIEGHVLTSIGVKPSSSLTPPNWNWRHSRGRPRCSENAVINFFICVLCLILKCTTVSSYLS